MYLDWNRVLSLLVCLAYLIGSLVWGGSDFWLILLAYLIIPIVCIWFSEEVGGFTGIAHGIFISSPTPGIFILIIGWVLLFMPVIVIGISSFVSAAE